MRILIFLIPMLLSSAAAMAFEALTATLRISSASLYDYVILGERPEASDGFDNAYDTITPGNLNADMGLPYIRGLLIHPEWAPPTGLLRGDIRSLAKKQEWALSIDSSLPAKTPLTVALQAWQTSVPKGGQVSLIDPARQKYVDLRAGSYSMPAPGPGEKSHLIIIVEQPQ